MFFHIQEGYPKHSHETVAEARYCEVETKADELAAMLDFAAEQATEDFFNNRGNYAGTYEDALDRWFDSYVGR